MTAPDNTAVGLVLAGGGARCAYQAGAIKAISEILPGSRNPFGVIVGQSGGAINAASLASRSDDFGWAARHLVRAWSRLKVGDVVRTDPVSIGFSALRWILTAASGGWLVENPRSFLDNTPLETLLERQIDFEAIETAVERKHLSALALTASIYASENGRAVTFFTGASHHEDWSRVRRLGVRRQLGAKHVLASSALPFLLPAQEIGGQFFGDGALRNTAPLSPAIRLGARRLLIITPRDAALTPPEAMGGSGYPSLGALAGHMLDILFNDYLDADVERLGRINETLGLLTPDQMAQTPLKPVEAFVLRPSQDVRQIAAKHADEIPRTLRLLLRGIGGWGGDWRLPSYLNFNGTYSRELMALGYRDAWESADRIRQIVSPVRLSEDTGPAGERAGGAVAIGGRDPAVRDRARR